MQQELKDAVMKCEDLEKKSKDHVTLTDVSSTKIEGNFFSVAITTPLAATNTTHISEREVKGCTYDHDRV